MRLFTDEIFANVFSNFLQYDWSDSFGPCDKDERSAFEVTFFINIEYYFRKAVYNWVKLSIDHSLSTENHSRAGHVRCSTNSLQKPAFFLIFKMSSFDCNSECGHMRPWVWFIVVDWKLDFFNILHLSVLDSLCERGIHFISPTTRLISWAALTNWWNLEFIILKYALVFSRLLWIKILNLRFQSWFLLCLSNSGYC